MNEFLEQAIMNLVPMSQDKFFKAMDEIEKESEGLLTYEAKLHLLCSRLGIKANKHETNMKGVFVWSLVASIDNGELRSTDKHRKRKNDS